MRPGNAISLASTSAIVGAGLPDARSFANTFDTSSASSSSTTRWHGVVVAPSLEDPREQRRRVDEEHLGVAVRHDVRRLLGAVLAG